MLPDHVLFDKAIDAEYAKAPALNLDQLEAAARKRVEAFKLLVQVPATPAQPPK